MKLPVVVLGGGPAGAACALALRMQDASVPVTVVEPRDFARWQPGESLSPPARQILESLGCWPRFVEEDFLPSYGIRAAWESERMAENDYLFSAHGCGWHLVRARFDAMLLRCAEAAGASVMRGRRLHPREVSSSASFVVDATGRNAVFASLRGVGRQTHDSLSAAFRVFQTTEETAVTTLIEAQEDGWWYAIPVPGDRLAVGWMSDPDLMRQGRLHQAEGWMERLEKSRHVSRLVRGATPVTEVDVRAAGSHCLNKLGGERWIAAGDSASTYDPLSGQGILKALRFGKIAAYAVLDSLRGRKEAIAVYQRLVQADYAAYLEQRARFYGLVKRWPESAFWRRRMSIPYQISAPVTPVTQAPLTTSVTTL